MRVLLSLGWVSVDGQVLSHVMHDHRFTIQYVSDAVSVRKILVSSACLVRGLRAIDGLRPLNSAIEF